MPRANFVHTYVPYGYSAINLAWFQNRTSCHAAGREGVDEGSFLFVDTANGG